LLLAASTRAEETTSLVETGQRICWQAVVLAAIVATPWFSMKFAPRLTSASHLVRAQPRENYLTAWFHL